MRGLLVVLFSSFLVCQIAQGQETTPVPVPTRPILPPPPPPPPNSPPNFERDNDDDDDGKAGETTPAPPPPQPVEPIPELIDTGGADLIVDIEFKSFQSTEENRFKTTMSKTCNEYCSTKGNCEGDSKIVSEVDVVVYSILSVKSMRTKVSFYIKNPAAFTQLAMTKEQLHLMFDAERSAIEADLGYRLDRGDLDGFVPFTNGLALDSWIIALLALIGLVIIVFAFVCFLNYRNKKTDTRMTFYDIEMQEESKEKELPPDGPDVPVDSPKKKVKVDVTTNVYEADIIAETKHTSSTTEPKTENPPEQEEGGVTSEKNEPPASPNAIVVVADVSSSNEGSSVSSEEAPTSPTSSDNTPPPDYEQAIQDETKVTEAPESEAAGTSEVDRVAETEAPESEAAGTPEAGRVAETEAPESEAAGTSDADPVAETEAPESEAAGTSETDRVAETEPPAASPTDDQEDLPPPPTPPQTGEPDSASAASVDLPPPPPPEQTEELSKIEPSASPADVKSEIDEATGEEARLITDDKSKVPENDGGLDNAGFETVINDEGEPSTEL